MIPRQLASLVLVFVLAALPLACITTSDGETAVDWVVVEREVGATAVDLRTIADMIEPERPSVAIKLRELATLFDSAGDALRLYLASEKPESFFGWAQLVFEATQPYVQDANPDVRIAVALARIAVNRAASLVAQDAGVPAPAFGAPLPAPAK